MHMKIKSPSEKDIYSFFLSLSDNVLYNFSLYPNANTKKVASKLSKTLLIEKSQKIFGIFEKDQMVGFGILKFLPKETRKCVCQFGLVISDLYQNKGFGKALAKYMIDWAKENNFKKIWLTVYSDNTRAIKLYNELGFQMEGIFMYNEYFNEEPRHSLSLALFFNENPRIERKLLWESLSEKLIS
jgi:RimJ/RimL family protein N-acetyltransferase